MSDPRPIAQWPEPPGAALLAVSVPADAAGRYIWSVREGGLVVRGALLLAAPAAVAVTLTLHIAGAEVGSVTVSAGQRRAPWVPAAATHVLAAAPAMGLISAAHPHPTSVALRGELLIGGILYVLRPQVWSPPASICIPATGLEFNLCPDAPALIHDLTPIP